jgi:predicted RNA-binding protein YlqC (UPF0109 family)
LRELLEYLARSLVESPDRVRVEEFEEDDGTLVLELSVGDDDYGRIIGRGGRTAQARRHRRVRRHSRRAASDAPTASTARST